MDPGAGGTNGEPDSGTDAPIDAGDVETGPVNAPGVPEIAADELWGECTDTSLLGKPVRALAIDHDISIDDTGAAISLGGVDQSGLDRLFDGCASDEFFVTGEALTIYTDPNQNGCFMWLAKDSGAAVVTAHRSPYSSWPRGGPKAIAVLASGGASSAAIFVVLGHDRWDFQIAPIDPDKPGRISEIRAVPSDQDISFFRKTRLSDNGAFAAANGDIRARVTAELAQTFGPTYFQVSEARWEKNSHYRTRLWVGATWETSHAILIQGVNLDTQYSKNRIDKLVSAGVGK